MSRQHSNIKIGNSGAFVNGLAVFASVALSASGYVSALGAFAGIAYWESWRMSWSRRRSPRRRSPA